VGIKQPYKQFSIEKIAVSEPKVSHCFHWLPPPSVKAVFYEINGQGALIDEKNPN
jgi:hypothetical protein